VKGSDDLVTVLQVGTRRTALPPLEVLPELEGCSTEKRALLATGVMDLMNRAGAIPLIGIQAINPASQEEGRITLSTAEPLSEAIGAGMASSVLEWAAKARLVGKVAPPSVLVKLLPLAQKHSAELLPVLGNRGKWLAALQGLEIKEADADDLTTRRSADPVSYRDWLGGELETMDWKERAQAVAVLRVGLSLADEPLLEQAMSDRRKEVREPACDLIASLEGSRAAKELLNLARPVLHLEKSLLRKSLSVNPPDPTALPKWLPKTPSRVDFGPKALALFDVIRYIPPSKWEIAVSPGQLLDLAAKTDYARAIIDGLQEAVVRFGDQDWIDLLFEYLFTRDAIKQECWSELAHCASEPVFDRVISSKLSGLGSDPQTAAWSLTFRKRPLSATLSRATVLAFRTSLNHHYVLRELAPYLHPGTVVLVEAPSSDEDHFEATREHVRKVLDIRRRLLASLDD
jgi:hypothetical protein